MTIVNSRYFDFFIYIGVLTVICIAILFIFSKPTSQINLETVNQTNMTATAKYNQTPQMLIDTKKKYLAILQTNKGNMTVDLFVDKTPITVNNFVFLVKEGFYDSTTFHRIIRDFMIQGGDPAGDGSGGPGYTFEDEKFSGKYTRGTMAMANRGPNTNGSQFFIIHKDYDLPPNYVIFGKVTEGLETLDKIVETPVEQSSTGELSKPKEKIVLEKVTVSEN